MTATLTDATSHACTGRECQYCGEPEELRLLRRVHIRPVLELNAGMHDAALAQLVTDELRPLLLAALRIREQAQEWASSALSADAERGDQIIRQFAGTPWELKAVVRPHIPEVQEVIDAADEEETLQMVRPAPLGRPRICRAVRTADGTGNFGIGIVGEGFQASDGAMSWRTLGGPPHFQPKWETYDNHGPDPFLQFGDHGESIRLVWLDDPKETESPS